MLSKQSRSSSRNKTKNCISSFSPLLTATNGSWKKSSKRSYNISTSHHWMAIKLSKKDGRQGAWASLIGKERNLCALNSLNSSSRSWTPHLERKGGKTSISLVVSLDQLVQQRFPHHGVWHSHDNVWLLHQDVIQKFAKSHLGWQWQQNTWCSWCIASLRNTQCYLAFSLKAGSWQSSLISRTIGRQLCNKFRVQHSLCGMEIFNTSPLN